MIRMILVILAEYIINVVGFLLQIVGGYFVRSRRSERRPEGL